MLHELIYRKRYEEVPRLFYDGEKQKIPINREDITTVYKLRETDTGVKIFFSLSMCMYKSYLQLFVYRL